MMKRFPSFSASAGFTLIEMITALLLSSLVLVGLLDISTNMLRRQFEGIRYGKVDSSTLLSLSQMTQTIEAATYLSQPVQGSGSMQVLGCSNYSSTMAGQSPFTGQINPSQPVTWFAYCVENNCQGGVNCNGNQGPWDLDYYWGSGACSPACDSGNPNKLVYQNVWLELPPSPYSEPFYFNYNDDGVDMHFDIGDPNSTAMERTPVFYQVDTAMIPDDGHFQ